jgi:hypothetical protein
LQPQQLGRQRLRLGLAVAGPRLGCNFTRKTLPEPPWLFVLSFNPMLRPAAEVWQITAHTVQGVTEKMDIE